MTTPAQPADGVEARTYWMRPEQLDSLKKKFHGGAVGLYVADVQTDLYSVPVYVGTLAASKADSAQEWPEAVQVCAEAYQVVGCLLDDLGIFDTPEAEKILDNLSEHRLVHRDVIPWTTPQPEGGRGEAVDALTPVIAAEMYRLGLGWHDTIAESIAHVVVANATPTDAARARDAEDARRYRWLREYDVDSYLACGRGEKLDAAIDAALAAVEGGKA